MNKVGKVFSGLNKVVKLCILVGILVLGIFAYNKISSFFGPKVNTEELNALLTKSSELTSAKLNYTGLAEYKDTGIKFLNRSDFTMVYRATVRAGIDVNKVEITTDNSAKIIYLKIPQAEVQDVNVDTSSIKYYDEKFSLFNTNEKEDSNLAISMAEESAKKEAANMGILEFANEQAENLVKGILANAIPDGYTIEVSK